MLRTANPALRNDTFTRIDPNTVATDAVMTIQGTVWKTAVLLLLATGSATWTWYLAFNVGPAAAAPWMIGGMLGGLVMSIVTIFAKKTAWLTAPMYALLEGLALGGISAYYAAQFQGIVMQAVALTFGTLGCLLLAYASRIIKATENFKLGIVAATGAIMMVYVLSMVLRLFGIQMPFIHESGPIGIGISLVIVVVAALNLVLDFDFIEQGAERRAPKYLEWYAAFGLMVTLVWLYLEILRLLSKLNKR